MTDFSTWWLDHKDCYFDIQLKSKAGAGIYTTKHEKCSGSGKTISK